MPKRQSDEMFHPFSERDRALRPSGPLAYLKGKCVRINRTMKAISKTFQRIIWLMPLFYIRVEGHLL
ncbi:hypothetical protein SVI_1465 [Shewanella violacea DSS12]|uniref:Uncharacterized protein n=1 Tax=Shewanella violacea (strain JCM 10179 / CIP 106290 / LMG 19151 / DSS12) TaxID=637905 RepID=D4ZID7_SHEVD|nr:hypothetical protein SVI_1465 [Shewanella violacea DSS12]